ALGIGIIGLLIIPYPPLRKVQRRLFWIVVGGIAIVIVGVYFSESFIELFSNVSLVQHIATRIQNMRNPYLSIHDIGYQPANALYAIADAGIFGRGLGNSVRKYGFLTQAESDYILSIVIEETGILGFGLIIIGYGILIWRFIHWALKSNRTSDKVLLTCAASYFMLHFFINVGGVSMLIPMTGVPLLMISAGGSALLSVCFCVGLTQSRISEIRHQSSS
ncbi:MAG: FtsW/RodA/SpoVE family cell cycle protein, partial [Allobaculum sp.]|nr:FtsW/RodA/SpoVE family cell cycle protein [Allobaculum sp.]